MCSPHARARVSDVILFKFFAQLKQVRHFISFPPPYGFCMFTYPLRCSHPFELWLRSYSLHQWVWSLLEPSSWGIRYVYMICPQKRMSLDLRSFQLLCISMSLIVFVKPRTPTDPPDYSLRNHRVSGVHLVRIPLTVDLWNHVSNRPSSL